MLHEPVKLAPGSTDNLFVIISPDKIAWPNWNDHAEKLFSKMKELKGVRLPGERRHQNRLNLGPRNINKELYEKIKKLT